MRKVQKIFFLFVVLCNSSAVFAQNEPAQMADTMRSNGRIYVVVAVVLTILIGLLLYVIRLDKKITKLERDK